MGGFFGFDSTAAGAARSALAATIALLSTAAATRAQTGACCTSNGICTIRDAATCASLGGDYMGDGAPCVANLCRGGCCRPNGTCSVNIPRLNCESNGGSYLGHGSECTGVNCPVLPNGACCREAVCQEGFTQGACPGLWPGDGTTCDDCPGACCLKDDSCVPSTRGECLATAGNFFGGFLTTCPPDGCGQGACCFASTGPGAAARPENCNVIDPFNCARSEGRYQGHGTDCATLTCPLFGGGCCCGGSCAAPTAGGKSQGEAGPSASLGGSCFVTTQEFCETLGCRYMGEGIACGAGSMCPGEGACCPKEGGACYQADGRSCVCAGDRFGGEGAPCTPDTCDGACIYKVKCLSGDCSTCSVPALEQECRDVEDPFTTCEGRVITKCPSAGSGCCVELELVARRPPAGEPLCPSFAAECTCNPQTGACCLQSGGCSVTTLAECQGTFRGEGTTCTPVQACCDEALDCTERAQVCCIADGDTSSAGSCGSQTALCHDGDGTCIAEANQTCCSGTPRACCVPDGDCLVGIEQECCEDLGGTPIEGAACGAPTACCRSDSSGCETLAPECCLARNGRVIAGEVCTEPEACCDFLDFDCHDEDPVCCSQLAEVPDGPGLCLPPRGCCDPDKGTECAEIDPGCCEIVGGTPLGDPSAATAGGGSSCQTPTACCLADGFFATRGSDPVAPCETADPGCCEVLGGTPLDGETCTQEQACCTFDGCFDLDPLCCDVVFGFPSDRDSCEPDQACCLPDGSCLHDDPVCCVEGWEGAPAGPDSTCVDGLCPAIGETESCCFADETCDDLARPVCTIRGGVPRGPDTRCPGDANGDGSDDECRTPGDANGDGQLDCDDLPIFNACLEQAGPAVAIPQNGNCPHANANDDRALDLRDFAELQNQVVDACSAVP